MNLFPPQPFSNANERHDDSASEKNPVREYRIKKFDDPGNFCAHFGDSLRRLNVASKI